MLNMDKNRRPIASRSSGWAKKISNFLINSSITPDQISMLSILFALVGGLALVMQTNWIGFLLCAFCIQARLMCNLMDGMVAVEGGKQSSLGVVFNEFPDRLTDAIFLIALGYVTPYPEIGWFCALIATCTAYIRVFGGSLGLKQDFRGPMAKAHRMAIMTVACLLAIVESQTNGSYAVLFYAAIVIAAGSLLTCGLRSYGIIKLLRGK